MFEKLKALAARLDELRFLDESVKEKQMFPETSEMKPEPEIRPEMDEQVKPDVGTSPTNSKEEQ